MTYVQVIHLPEVPPEEPIQLSIPLFPIEMEATFQLRNIYFDFNSDRLRPESIPELERLLRLLQQNPNIRIRFSGHTDNIGSDKYNQNLSERRARAVYEWLRQRGVHPIQMEYIGYGKTRPIASNATEEGRSLNRRIEMEVVGIRKSAGQAAIESQTR
jgi:outer membrane protein OmpA-like peptidoglycan-associated protein